MKKKLLVALSATVILLFTGCRATPSTASSIAQLYNTTKTILVAGQEVVIINSDLLDKKTLNTLEHLNESVTIIDKTIKELQNEKR